MKNILIAFLAFAAIELSTGKEKLSELDSKKSSLDYKFLGKKEEYRFGVELKENKQFHHTKTDEDGVRLGCYGHEQDGKEYMTHYVADGKGYRLVPHQSIITVYPKDGGEPRQASFVDAFSKEEINTSNVKYLFPGGCKSPVIEYTPPVYTSLANRESGSSGSAKAGARKGSVAGKTLNAVEGDSSSSKIKGEGKLEGVIKEELTEVNRLNGGRGRADKSLKSDGGALKVAGGVDGSEPAAAVGAIHHYSTEGSSSPSHGAGGSTGTVSGSSGSTGDINSATAGKLRGNIEGANGRRSKSGGALNGGLNGNLKSGSGSIDGNAELRGNIKGAKEGRSEIDGALIGGLTGNLKSGAGPIEGSAESFKGDDKNGAGIRTRGGSLDGKSGKSGKSLSDTGANGKRNGVAGDATLGSLLSLKGSLKQGTGGIAANGARSGLLPAGGSSANGDESGELSRTYIPVGPDSASSVSSNQKHSGESISLTPPTTSTSTLKGSGVTSSSSSAGSLKSGQTHSGSSATALKSSQTNSPAIAISSATSTNSGQKNSRTSSALSSSTVKNSAQSSLSKSENGKTGISSDSKSSLKSSDQCSDTCCDDDSRPQLLLNSRTASPCCKNVSKLVLPIFGLEKISTSEIIEVTSETNTAAMLKKLLKLVEKYDL